MRRAVVFAVVMLAVPGMGIGLAQSLAKPARKLQGARTTDNPPDTRGLSTLPQVEASGNGGAAEVGIQAADLFINDTWRLYLRSTVPMPRKDDQAADEGGTPATAPAAELESNAVAALLDPYGGLLNVTTGIYRRADGAPTGTSGDGWFFDARAGLKLVSLPGQTKAAPTVLNVAATPFYTATAALKFRSQLVNVDAQKAGYLEAAIAVVANAAADRTLSAAFADDLLDEKSFAARVDVAITVTSNAAITISFSPWNSTGFGKRFTAGLKLLNTGA